VTKRTKKVGSAAKFGARYGVSIRSQLKEIDRRAKSLYPCPSCNYTAVKRISTGIWKCRHCKTTFAGAAYTPVTLEKIEGAGAKEKKETEEKKENNAKI